MPIMQKFKRYISLFVVVAMLGGQALPLQAAMIGTDTQLQQEQSRYDRQQLLQLLDREDMQQQLQAMGVDQDAAKARVAQMTDSEIQQLNAKLAEMPAGGDAVGIVVLFLVIFIITDLLGATDIFPFIHPIN